MKSPLCDGAMPRGGASPSRSRVRAQGLLQRGLIDRDSEARLERRHVGAEQLIAQCASQLLTQPRRLWRIRLERGRACVNNAKHYPLRRLAARGAAESPLSGAKDCLDQRAVRAPTATLETGGRLDRETVGGRDGREGLPLLHLVEEILGAEREASGGPFVAPARRDILPGLVERAVARRRDRNHVVPDVALRRRYRIVLCTDIRRECSLDDAAGLRQAGDKPPRR